MSHSVKLHPKLMTLKVATNIDPCKTVFGAVIGAQGG